MARNLKENPLTTAERVEQLLAVRLQLRLVVYVDEELLAIQDIRDTVLLRIVCHEPVNEAETHGTAASQNGQHLFESPRLVIKILEPTDDEILFALDAALLGLSEWCWIHGLRLQVVRWFRWAQEKSAVLGRGPWLCQLHRRNLMHL